MFITNAKSDKRYIVSDFYVDHFDELTKLINLQKRFVFFHSMKYRNIILHNLNGINHIETFKSQCAQSTDIPHAHRRYLAENDPTPHESVVRVNLLNAIHSSEWVAVVSSIGSTTSSCSLTAEFHSRCSPILLLLACLPASVLHIIILPRSILYYITILFVLLNFYSGIQFHLASERQLRSFMVSCLMGFSLDLVAS